MALLVALCWRGAVPGGVELMGVAVTSIGVAMVLWRAQDGSAWNPDLQAGARLRAVMAALLGALGQAGGLVMAQVAMTPGPDQPQTVPALSATLVRMVAGAGGILLVGLVSGRLGAWRAIVRQRVLGHSLIGTAVGPILGVWLSLVALQHLSAGAASALMVTTPLFLLPITWFAYRARIGWLGLTGTLLTVAGAVTLVLDKS